MKPAHVLLASALALGLTGCAVGPGYRQMAVTVPRQWPG